DGGFAVWWWYARAGGGMRASARSFGGVAAPALEISGRPGCAAASRARSEPMRPDPMIASPRALLAMILLHLADRLDGVLGLLAVLVPPRAEFVTIEIVDAAAETLHGLHEFRILDGLGDGFAPDGDDRLRHLGLGEQAVPLIVFGRVAQLLQGGNVGEALGPLAAHGAHGAQRPSTRLRTPDRRMGREQGGMVAEHGGQSRPAARRRQVAHLGAGRLEHDLDRQMGSAVESTRCIDDLAGPLPGVLDHLLEIAPGLARIDEQHRRLGRDKRDRRELVAGEARRSP